MTSWKRITLVVFLLVGGTMVFSYWSINQFDNIFSNLEETLIANMLLASSSLKTKTESTTESTLIPPETSELLTIPTDLELSFNFPQKGDKVYIGCTYPISWQSSTIINLLGTVLVDAGTSESAGEVASGLAKENRIEKDLQNLNWKVGVVWPGAYYIKVLKINEVEAEFRSKVFEINKMSENISTSEKENVCEESGGSF